MNTLVCPTCNAESTLTSDGMTTTLVGYSSPLGHDHDDNCHIRVAKCGNGHTFRVSKRRTCPSCNWKGKEACFCHPQRKLDDWPSMG